jgi:hypothetical protein
MAPRTLRRRTRSPILFQSFPVSIFILVADVLNFVIVETIHGHVVGEDRDYFLFLKGATAP